MKIDELRQVILPLLLSGWLGSAAFGQAKDYVYSVTGAAPISGKIASISADEVKISTKGNVQSIPVDQIAKLKFSDDPSGMSGLRSAMEAGQLEKAKSLLTSIQPKGRPYIRQELDFARCYIQARLALQGTGSVTDAARQMGGFLKSNPTSFYFYRGCESMGDLAMSLGKYSSAAKYYAKLSKSSSAPTKARGDLLQGDALLREGNADQALAMYQRVTKSSDLRLRAMGQIGVATCDIERGQANAAIKLLEEVIAKNDSKDVELFARAYNSLGKAYLATGNTDAALESYLHTDLLFYRDLDRHAEALFHLAQLWTSKNKPTEATRARNTLKSSYSGSQWAQK